MNKYLGKFTFSLIIASIFTFYSLSLALDTPTITGTAKGPNQINLTWSAVTNPGWGYKFEMQSSADSRYSSWTTLPITRDGRSYLPYWVTESHYKDVIDGSGTSTGSAAQFQMYGLQYGTTYNFRVRCYGKTDAGVDTYGSYSNTASATTTTPGVIRYVISGGAGSQNGTSWGNAWPNISSANGVAAGTLVLVRSGNYAADNVNPSTSGTQANHTVFQAEPVSGTNVTITSVTGGIPSIYLTSNYIVVDGINVANSDATNQRVVVTGTRNAVVNCDLNAQNAGYGMVAYVSSSYNLFHYNAIYNGMISDPTGGFTLAFFGSGADYNVAQYNHIYNGGHDTGLTQNGADYNQWKNNLMDGGYGLGWECVSAGGQPKPTYNLFEGNVVKDVQQSASGGSLYYKPGIELSGDYNTVRRNLIYNGRGTSPSYSHGIELSAFNGGQTANYNLIYNNTIYSNGGQGIAVFGVQAVNNNTIKNNIFAANQGINPDGYTQGIQTAIAGSTSLTGNVIDYNVMLPYSGGNPNPSGISAARLGVERNTTNANAWLEWGGPSGHNITTTPDFINAAGWELHLKSTATGLIGYGVSVTDSTWGTTGETNLGAFKYYDISSVNTSPSAPTNLRIIP